MKILLLLIAVAAVGVYIWYIKSTFKSSYVNNVTNEIAADILKKIEFISVNHLNYNESDINTMIQPSIYADFRLQYALKKLTIPYIMNKLKGK